MNLLGTLGLDAVEADPNVIPVGRYNGVIFKSEYVHVTKSDSVSHVITYQVTDGDRKGAQRQEWFNLGVNPTFDATGNIVALTPTMSEVQKPWYKKRLVDLGITEEAVSTTFHPSQLVGKQVVFGLKANGSYLNINFVELAGPPAGNTAGTPVNVPPTGDNVGGLAGVV